MIGDARARVDACAASRAFRRPACPSRRASWSGRANERRGIRGRPAAGGGNAPGPACSAAPCCLSLSPSSRKAQSRLGRLFSDPEQRTELDRLRSEVGVTASGEPVAGPVETESRPGPDGGPPQHAATFNGLVVRGDGHRVAWFDGVETLPGATTPTGVRHRRGTPARRPAPAPAAGRSDERRSRAGPVHRHGGQGTRRVRARLDRDRYGRRRRAPGGFGWG